MKENLKENINKLVDKIDGKGAGLIVLGGIFVWGYVSICNSGKNLLPKQEESSNVSQNQLPKQEK